MKLRTLRNVFGLAAIGWILGNGTAFGQTATWLGGAEGQTDQWDAAGNWSRSSGVLTTNALPVGGDVVEFGNRIVRNITVGSPPRAAGTLRFTASTGTAYTIGGASESSPQINLSGRENLVEVTSGSPGATINARIGVQSIAEATRNILHNGSSQLNFAGGVHFQDTTGTRTLSVGGAGNVRIGSLSTAGTSSLVVAKEVGSGGSLLLDGGISGNVTVAGGAVVTGNSTLNGSMTVSGSVANLTVNSGSAQVSSGGSVSNMVLNAGTAQVNASGSVTSMTVNSGTAQVNASGSVSNLTVNSGTAQVNASGNVSTMIVNNTGSAVVNGTVSNLTVNSGGVLSGTGTITTATIGNGGQHRPGTSPGLQSFTNLTYNNGSTFVWELNGTGSGRGIDFDAVDVSSTLTFDSGAISNLVIDSGLLSNTSFWSTNRSWQVFNAGTVIGNLSITPAQATQFSSLGTFVWDGGTLRFSAVPEPGTLALLGLVSTVGFGVTRFRKRKCKAAV